MGYIKKLKSNELVGGTDKTTIYPVTSTEAVFEEVIEDGESNFKSQKFLNNNITGDRINGGAITDYNIAEGTITKGKLIPQVQAMLDEGQKKALTPKGNYNPEEVYEALDLVFDPITNSSYVSLITPNTYPVDESAGGYEEGKWSKVLDGTAVNTAQATINAKVDQLNNQVTNAIGQAQQDVQDLIDETATALQEATDDAIGATEAALAAAHQKVSDAQIGYYISNTPAATALKQTTTNIVGEDEYVPASGGAVKIYMQFANTSTGTVELQFGSNPVTKKRLLYNGEYVSQSNTWDNEEVISVYYDPTYNNNTGAYFASNAQGGGGKAEKIKYDNSQSGLVATNVQGAVDEVVECVQLQDIEEYSSTLSVPSNEQFRIIVPFNFFVGETYHIEVSTENAVSKSVRFYVYRTGQYSNNTNKMLGEIPAGGTTAKTTYTPVSETNYQFFGFWNNNNAATSVNVTITKKQEVINNIVSDTQDVVKPLELEEFFNDHLPDLKVLDYDIYDIKNLNIHNCVVDANNKWYASNASYGLNAKHIAVPVIDGSIVIMRGNYNVMQFWLNASYNPNTTYGSGSSAPIVGSRQFIEGTDAVLYTPTNAAYFAVSVVDGTYLRSVDPIIIVVKNYINKAVSIPHITTDFEVGCTNEANLKCVKSEDNIYTFVCYNSVQYNYAYIKIPVVVGHKYRLCFNAAARAKLNSEWNGLIVLKKTNPEERINDGNYNSATLGKTNKEYFEWNFTAEYPIAYMRSKATDLGNPNFGNATIVVKNIKLIDMGTTDMDAATPILMDKELSAINSILDSSAIIDIADDGLYVCDRYLNVGGYLDTDGIHANNLN